MKKIILVLVLLILAGCGGDSSDGISAGDGYYKYTGDQLVKVSFSEGFPESDSEYPYIASYDKIPIEFTIYNYGLTKIPAGDVKIRLKGDAIIPDLFDGGEGMFSPGVLQGIDQETGEVLEEYVRAGPLIYEGYIETLISKDINAEYCYKDEVRVRTRIILTDSLDEVPEENIKEGDNPPSRVKVSSLTQDMVRAYTGSNEGMLNFEFIIKNDGSGRVVDSLEKCFVYDKNPMEYVSVNVKGPYPISCNGERVLLRNGEGKVRCSMQVDASNLGSDERDLFITLYDFAYLEQVEPVEIWIEP